MNNLATLPQCRNTSRMIPKSALRITNTVRKVQLTLTLLKNPLDIIQDRFHQIEKEKKSSEITLILTAETFKETISKHEAPYEQFLDQKHDDLVKKSLLTKSQLEGYLKENTKVISDLKVKEEKDIDKMIEMDKQLKFLNEIVYTRNQSIQTIHMLAPKCATYNGRLTFANPRFAPEREETMTLKNES
ncbi:hypothetical protein Tco_0752143 [Tanacetum coccineum]|uniref:Uncharacterized protein n=1 Tax=Tanacetum coccineum TaxID=301880 RepID=A0ABQ4Z9A6_9ASTR